MTTFTPQDWIEIGTSLIAAWFGCRFAFLFVCALIGAEPAPQQIEVTVTATVQHVDGEDE